MGYDATPVDPNTELSHKILSKLGAGGMGEVYLAQDTSALGRTVALKLLSAEVASNKDLSATVHAGGSHSFEPQSSKHSPLSTSLDKPNPRALSLPNTSTA